MQYPAIDSIKYAYSAENNDEVKVKVWDSTNLKTLNSNFYSQADGIILVFDITNKESFDMCQAWI